MRSFEDIAADFAFLDDWEDRYRYIIELGRELPTLPEEEHTEENRVHGCVSQVWLKVVAEGSGPDAKLHFLADSDAIIVKGLIHVLLSTVEGRSAREIMDMDIAGKLAQLGLQEHLTQQRANGLASMIERLKAEAHKVAQGG